jgi:hypothetical protein
MLAAKIVVFVFPATNATEGGVSFSFLNDPSMGNYREMYSHCVCKSSGTSSLNSLATCACIKPRVEMSPSTYVRTGNDYARTSHTVRAKRKMALACTLFSTYACYLF